MGHDFPLRRDTVRGILDGYGAEDIAVMRGHPVSEVRAIIVKLRRDGRLQGLCDQARARA